MESIYNEYRVIATQWRHDGNIAYRLIERGEFASWYEVACESCGMHDDNLAIDCEYSIRDFAREHAGDGSCID